MFTDNGEFKRLLWWNYRHKQKSIYLLSEQLDENGFETLLSELGFKNEYFETENYI